MEALRANRGVARIATVFAVLTGLALAGVLIARGAGDAQAGILPPCVPPLDDRPARRARQQPNPTVTGPNDPKRKVIFVGNNWEGTADIVSTQGPKKFKTLSRINIVPDYDERVMRSA